VEFSSAITLSNEVIAIECLWRSFDATPWNVNHSSSL
jgi:hypothetical protein